ncbi:MAG TPA: gluconokinase [Actinocrinis sp.]|jgi:gluconokinase|uniref:gluconokinase n=1 Tax=Actinocrinis sp. TaxID=1920516 RepID=UPI002DDD476D|nr:gluconokinase [Actinocrinis sp.]HEV3168939.1 gluconokinase [Actinocrinis sp.]
MQSGKDAQLPPVLLVTGVSGSGKTTVGSLLAGQLGWTYAEADAFHPPANIAKMHAGHPLTDADRVPWLDAIGAWIDKTTAEGRPAVVTCSALKRSYRERLRAGRPNVTVIYLDADPDTVRTRLAAREGHFFPAELLASQFRDLEPPAPQEHIEHVRVGLDVTGAQIVQRLLDEHGAAWRAGAGTA